MKRGPKNAKMDLLYREVREIFDYDKKTGILTWKTEIAKHICIGTAAGNLDATGRVRIGIKYRRYLAHRIIWLWMTGAWPKYEIDHRDGIKSNNAWNNLREATPSQNHFNIGLKKHNTSGYKGVSPTPNGRWYSKIRIYGRQTYLGTFDTAEQAYAAYCKAAKKHHGVFAKL